MFKRSNFIERSLAGALSFFKDAIFADQYAARPGFLQSRDPRIKVLSIALFLLAALWARHIPVLVILYAVCLALACVSSVNLLFFLKRTWFFIPFFALMIAVPAVFSMVTPGESLARFHLAGLELSITRQGLYGAGLFFMRVLVSVSFAVLLTLTTRHTDLLRVLRVFRVPSVFVFTIGMCYRYLYLFVCVVENTYLALKSRVGVYLNRVQGRTIVAWHIASLWQRSYRMHGDVYGAMVSRGYRGEPVAVEEFRMRPVDLAWLAGAAAGSAALLWFDRGWGG